MYFTEVHLCPSNPCCLFASSIPVAYLTFGLRDRNFLTISNVVFSFLCAWWPQWTAAYTRNGYWYEGDHHSRSPCRKASNERYRRQVNAMSTWASGNNDSRWFKKYSCVVWSTKNGSGCVVTCGNKLLMSKSDNMALRINDNQPSANVNQKILVHQISGDHISHLGSNG